MSNLSPLRRVRPAALICLLVVATACQTAPAPSATPVPASPTSAPPPTRTPVSPPQTATATPLPELFGPEKTYLGQLALVEEEPELTDCKQPSPFDLPADGLIQVAFLPTQICLNEEIGLLDIGDRLYVVQGGGFEAAFMLIDVTDPTQPSLVGRWGWTQVTYTADVKPFRQGERWYLALGMEAQSANPSGTDPCGVGIVDVTDPGAPKVVTRYDGWVLGSSANWCNVHTTEVDTDANGDANYLIVTSNDSADVRVLDIRDLKKASEVNRYRTPKFEFTRNGRPSTFVHDTTIAGDRVYVSYWGGGVIILDKAQLESGAEVTPLNPPGSIDPPNFFAHHSYPTPDGDFVFVEDELDRIDDGGPPFSQLRLWDIRDLSAPKEVLDVELDNPIASPHNLLIDGDLLYVGWYQEGVRIFRYDVSDPDQPTTEPVFAQPVRAKREEGVFGSAYDGVWGVRLHACQVDGRATTCIYASDLTLGLIILALP